MCRDIVVIILPTYSLHGVAGSDSLAQAVVVLLRDLHSHPGSNVKLEDAMMLLVVADCLAAKHALALRGQSAGDQSSPWDPDQERMIKVNDSCSSSYFTTVHLETQELFIAQW